MYFVLESNAVSCIRQKYVEPSFCKMEVSCGENTKSKKLGVLKICGNKIEINRKS